MDKTQYSADSSELTINEVILVNQKYLVLCIHFLLFCLEVVLGPT